MPTTSVLSQGSAFYVLDDTVASPAVVRQITQTKGITGLGGSRTIIDVTNLDSTAKDKAAGLMDSGSISFEIVENPANVAHQLLETLANTGTKPSKQWYFGLSDGLATAPGFIGTFAAPPLVLQTPKNTTFNARTGYLFTGFIKQYTRDIAANGIVSVKGGIEITGPVFTAINGLTWTA